MESLVEQTERLRRDPDNSRGQIASFAALYRRHMAEKTPFAPDLEERYLTLILDHETPGDGKMSARLMTLLHQQGKAIPVNIRRAALEHYVAEQPGRADLRRQLLTLKLSQGETVSREEVEAAFPDYPGELKIHQFLAPLYEAADDDPEPLRTTTETLSHRFPDCPQCFYFHASLLIDLPGSKDELAALMERTPSDPRFLQAMRRLAARASALPGGIPAAFEERYLALILEHEQPGDGKLSARLMTVLQKRDRGVPAAIRRAALEYYIREDPNRTDLCRQLLVIRLENKEMVSREELLRAFPEYPGELKMHQFLVPLYEAAHQTGEASHLEMPLRLLFERFPECPHCLTYVSRWHYDFGSPEESMALLTAHEDLALAHDFSFAVYVRVLRYLKQDEKVRDAIRSFFRTYKGDLWREHGFAQKQSAAIARGVPSVIIVTLPKSGTLFLLNTIAEGLKVPYSYLCPLGLFSDMVIEERVRDVAAGGALVVDHLDPVEANLDALHRNGIRDIVFHYRDLRQSALSFVHHGAADGVKQIPRHMLLKHRTNVGGDETYFEREYHHRLLQWLPFLEGWDKVIREDSRFRFRVTNFDELDDQREIIRRIIGYFGASDDMFDWSVLKADKKKRAGHFRKGLKDEWREVLSPGMQETIDRLMKERPALANFEARWLAGLGSSSGSR